MKKTTKKRTIVSLPCTAQKLECALHSICELSGAWDSEVSYVERTECESAKLVIETEDYCSHNRQTINQTCIRTKHTIRRTT
jgi:hypothetical protein